MLKGVFPEDRGGLREVEGRLRREGTGGDRGGGRGREGGSDEDVLFDVRGRDPVFVPVHGRGDPLIHVFVDQLSLLFSLEFKMLTWPLLFGVARTFCLGC